MTLLSNRQRYHQLFVDMPVQGRQRGPDRDQIPRRSQKRAGGARCRSLDQRQETFRIPAQAVPSILGAETPPKGCDTIDEKIQISCVRSSSLASSRMSKRGMFPKQEALMNFGR